MLLKNIIGKACIDLILWTVEGLLNVYSLPACRDHFSRPDA